jgi:hypothetical protein
MPLFFVMGYGLAETKPYIHDGIIPNISKLALSIKKSALISSCYSLELNFSKRSSSLDSTYGRHFLKTLIRFVFKVINLQ